MRTELDTWLQLLQTFGLAVTILIFIGFAGWRVAGWTGKNIVMPVVDRYLRLIDGLVESVRIQAKTSESAGAVLQETAVVLQRLSLQASQEMQTLSDIARSVAEIRANNLEIRTPEVRVIREPDPKESFRPGPQK